MDSTREAIRTFLIADVRGYTLFTQERGDEAAAKLAAKFAQVVREAVERRDGSLIELRGDEALVVFSSPRQAIRAAVELQERFVDETLTDPSHPLTVGIGLDAGEAVPVEGGYRGGALNTAARLCGQAGAGECLATQEVTHLARTVEGVRYQDRGALTLKGLTDPVRVVRLLPTEGDPVTRLAPVVRPTPRPPRGPSGWVRRNRVAAALVTVAVVAAAISVAVTRGGDTPEITGDAVGVLDLESGEVIDSVELQGRPGAIAAGEGAIWIAQPDQGVVARIDPETRALVDTIQVGSDPVAVAVGDGSVWVANAGTATISRVSPDTNTVTQTIDAPSTPAGIVVSRGSVWVTSTIDDTVSRIDSGGGRLEQTIEVGDRPSGLAVVDDLVWVANSGSGTVSRITVEGEAEAAVVDVGNGPTVVAGAAGEIWVSNALDGTVSRVDPATNTVTATIMVGEEPGGIAAAGGAVWIANELDGTLSKIGPDSSDAQTVSLGSEVAGAASIGDTLWIGVRASDAAHRGGALSVVTTFPLDSLDPAVSYSSQGWSVLSSTNAGLVGFKNVGGLEGTALVPNLATSLPTPTENGRTYSFQLRRDIRYSTGDPVRPEDVRRTIERNFTVTIEAGGPMMFSSIVGADQCDADSCDLSEGIVADDAANTVTFQLETPDPEFLYKLALPFAFIVPGDTPDHEATEPLPSTGPYHVVSHSRTEILLERSPTFEEWSAAARPEGIPDRIVWRYEREPQTALDDVVNGRADLLFDSPEAGTIEELRASHPGQVHAFPAPQTWFLNLDVTRPPFDDLRARQALNFAVDRERLVELTGGLGEPSCQILPPNFPGYQPYCPYTDNPSEEGTWDGPDVLEAQRLVRESGTVGSRVTMWTSPVMLNGAGSALGEHLSDVLAAIGYRPDVKAVASFERYEAGTFLGGEQLNSFVTGWVADYPEESGFIPLQYRCDAPANFSGFCDRALDRRMDQVEALQANDPTASAAWAEIERAIIDQAPIVPLVNIPIVHVVSERVGNYQAHPQWSLLVDQLWVR